MAGEDKRRNLGRGLSALLGENGGEDYSELDKPGISKPVPIEELHPGHLQPRRSMDEELIEDLARSVREKGILQPLLVRRLPGQADAYEIVAGERRWRAAQQAQLHEVPVIIKELTDREALEIAMVENLQRQDLSPLEEAEGYSRLMEEFSHNQKDLAHAVSKSRSHVANMLRLLDLPDPVKKMLDGGTLTAGHARALLTADDPTALAGQVAKLGLNVRQTEKLAQKKGQGKGRKTKGGRKSAAKDADILALERDLVDLLGLKVEIRFLGKEKGGTLTVHYRTVDQLDDILGRLSHGGGAAKPPGKNDK